MRRNILTSKFGKKVLHTMLEGRVNFTITDKVLESAIGKLDKSKLAELTKMIEHKEQTILENVYLDNDETSVYKHEREYTNRNEMEKDFEKIIKQMGQDHEEQYIIDFILSLIVSIENEDIHSAVVEDDIMGEHEVARLVDIHLNNEIEDGDNPTKDFSDNTVDKMANFYIEYLRYIALNGENEFSHFLPHGKAPVAVKRFIKMIDELESKNKNTIIIKFIKNNMDELRKSLEAYMYLYHENNLGSFSEEELAREIGDTYHVDLNGDETGDTYYNVMDYIEKEIKKHYSELSASVANFIDEMSESEGDLPFYIEYYLRN